MNTREAIINCTHTYSEDLDIGLIATEIFNSLKQKCSNTESQERSLQRLHEKLKRCTSIVDVTNITTQIDCLNKEIRNLRKHVEATSFLEQAKPLVDRYRALPPPQNVLTSGQGLKVHDNSERHEIIQLFLQVASRFSSSHYICTRKQIPQCSQCGRTTFYVDAISGHMVCACGNQVPLTVSETISSGPDTNRRMSNSRDNFLKMIMYYQGDVSRPPDEVLHAVVNELNRKNVRSDLIRQQPLRNGKRGAYVIQYIVDALKTTNNSSYYHCIYLIAQILWGWEKNDISRYVSQIMECYDLTQNVFLQLDLKCPQFKVTYRLCWHLRNVGIDSRLSDFKQIRSETISRYESARQEICDYLVNTGSPEFAFESLL